MSFFGLDIGSSSIKLVQLEKSKEGKLALKKFGETKTPQPGIQGQTEEQWLELVDILKRFLEELKVTSKDVVMGLTEDEVISRLKWFPAMKENEVKTALEFEAETFIPHPLSKVQIDYQIVDHDEDGRLLVFVVASLKKMVKKYTEIAKMAKLNLLALETPSIALSRILAIKTVPTLIVDLASQYSNLIASKDGNVFLTRTVPIGVNAFLRSISVSLGLDESVAESYRRTYGFLETELEGKVRKSMMPILDKLVEEIKKTTYSFREEWKDEIKVLVLAGGGAITPELAEELTTKLGIEVQVANPFSQVEFPKSTVIDVRKEGSRFGVAVGLAARGLL